MRASTQRTILASVWIGAFVIASLGWMYLAWIVGIGTDARSNLGQSLLDQYMPLLGTVVGFYLAGSVGRRARTGLVPFGIALVLSVIWNLLTLGFVIRAWVNPDYMPDAIKGLATYTPRLSWIAAPVIGYFFGKSHEVEK